MITYSQDVIFKFRFLGRLTFVWTPLEVEIAADQDPRNKDVSVFLGGAARDGIRGPSCLSRSSKARLARVTALRLFKDRLHALSKNSLTVHLPSSDDWGPCPVLERDDRACKREFDAKGKPPPQPCPSFYVKYHKQAPERHPES